MKKIILILILFTNNSWAANWLESSSDQVSTIFIDADSIIAEKEHNLVISMQFWIKREYIKPQYLDKGDKRRFDTLLTLFKIYCKNRKYELLSTTARLGNKVVFVAEEVQAMGDIAPETDFEKYYYMACKEAVE